ncbi:MAG: glycosyltransferase, partial [Microthrixaceae bacterium]
MDFLWLGATGGGSVPPQLGLCEAIIAAGHRLRAVVDSDSAAQFKDAGIPCEVVQLAERPRDESGPEMADWIYANRFMGPMFNDALLASIDRARPERLLIDGFLYDAQVEARGTGIPYGVVGHILVGAAWGGLGAKRLDRNHLAAHNERRRRVGLEPVSTTRDTLLDADWFLAMTYDVLDAPDARNWPKRHYVGAHVPAWSPVDIELPAGDDPLVVVGFSTTPMGQGSVVQRVVDALGQLNVRVMVTSGPAMDPTCLDLPNNAVAVSFVPHDQILPDAALMVSHVGHGSMAAAARHGVPILALPMGRDQDRNAEVLAGHGIGSWLPPTADSGAIADAAEAILSDVNVRQASSVMAQRIAQHP